MAMVPPALIKIPIKAVADPEGLAKLYVVQAKDGLCCVSVEGIDMVSFRIDHNEGLTPRELAIANNCAVDVSMVAYPDKESLEWLFTLIN